MAEPIVWKNAAGVDQDVNETSPLPANPQILSGTALVSAAHTTTQTSADLVNTGGRGLVVFLSTTLIGRHKHDECLFGGAGLARSGECQRECARPGSLSGGRDRQ
jgi:hypothetical protein